MALLVILSTLPANTITVEAATKKQPTRATSITANTKSVNVAAGKSSSAIRLTLNKKATKDVTISIKSSNTKVAKVTKSKVAVKKGQKAAATTFRIKGVKTGNAKVTVSLTNSKGKKVKKVISVTVDKERMV